MSVWQICHQGKGELSLYATMCGTQHIYLALLIRQFKPKIYLWMGFSQYEGDLHLQNLEEKARNIYLLLSNLMTEIINTK